MIAATLAAGDSALLLRTLLAAIDLWGDATSIRSSTYEQHRYLTAVHINHHTPMH